MNNQRTKVMLIAAAGSAALAARVAEQCASADLDIEIVDEAKARDVLVLGDGHIGSFGHIHDLSPLTVEVEPCQPERDYDSGAEKRHDAWQHTIDRKRFQNKLNTKAKNYMKRRR